MPEHSQHSRDARAPCSTLPCKLLKQLGAVVRASDNPWGAWHPRFQEVWREEEVGAEEKRWARLLERLPEATLGHHFSLPLHFLSHHSF